MIGRVVPGYKVFKLPFDIPKQTGSTKAEKIGLEPSISKFLLDERKIGERIFCLGYSPGWFVTDMVPGSLVIIPDLPNHGQTDWQGGIDTFLPG